MQTSAVYVKDVQSGICLSAVPCTSPDCKHVRKTTPSPAAFTDDSFSNPLVLLKSLFHVLSSHTGTLRMHSEAASQSGRELRLAYAHRAWVIPFPRECTTTSLQRNFPSHFTWKRGRAKKALGPSYSVVQHHILPMCKTSNPHRVIRKRVRRSCFCQFRCNLLPLFDTLFFCVCFFVQFVQVQPFVRNPSSGTEMSHNVYPVIYANSTRKLHHVTHVSISDQS